MATTASKTTAKSLGKEIKNQTKNLTDTINNELFSKKLTTQSKVEKLQNLIQQTSETMEELFNDPKILKRGVKGICVFETYTEVDVTTIDFKFKATINSK